MRTIVSSAVSTTVGDYTVVSLLGLSGRIRVGLAKEAISGTSIQAWALDDDSTPGATGAPIGRYVGTISGPPGVNSGLDFTANAPAAVLLYRAAGTDAVNAELTGDDSARPSVAVAAPTVVGDFGAAQSLSSFNGPVIAAWEKGATAADVAEVWSVDDDTTAGGTGSPKGRKLFAITGPQGNTSAALLPATLPAGVVIKRAGGTVARNVILYGASVAPSGAATSVDSPAIATMTGGTGVAITADAGNVDMNATLGAMSCNAGTSYSATGNTTANMTATTGALTCRAAGGAATLQARTNATIYAETGNVACTADFGSCTFSGYTSASLSASFGGATLQGQTTCDVTASTGALTCRATLGAATLRGGTNAIVTADAGLLSCTATAGAAELQGQTTCDVRAVAGNLTCSAGGAFSATGATGASVIASTGNVACTSTAGDVLVTAANDATIVATGGIITLNGTKIYCKTGPLWIDNIPAPAANPAAGSVFLYVDVADSKLKVKDSAGVVTVLNP